MSSFNCVVKFKEIILDLEVGRKYTYLGVRYYLFFNWVLEPRRECLDPLRVKLLRENGWLNIVDFGPIKVVKVLGLYFSF